MKGGDDMSVEIRNNPDVEDSCCNQNHSHSDNNEACCLCERIKYIYYLQKRCSNEECCINCGSTKLGKNVPGLNTFNTRPFKLYLTDGEEFSIFDPFEDTNFNLFRVQSIHNCCAVLRALKVESFTSPEDVTYKASDLCLTVDICKFIGIQCFPDTYIPC